MLPSGTGPAFLNACHLIPRVPGLCRKAGVINPASLSLAYVLVVALPSYTLCSGQTGRLAGLLRTLGMQCIYPALT